MRVSEDFQSYSLSQRAPEAERPPDPGAGGFSQGQYLDGVGVQEPIGRTGGSGQDEGQGKAGGQQYRIRKAVGKQIPTPLISKIA